MPTVQTTRNRLSTQVPLIGGQTPQWDAHQNRPDDGNDAHLRGDREHLLDNVQHRAVFLHLDGVAQVPLEQVAQILAQLHNQRLVQAILGIQGVNGGLGGGLFRQPRVARNGVHEEKGYTGDNEQGQQRHEYSFHGIFCHLFTSYFVAYI